MPEIPNKATEEAIKWAASAKSVRPSAEAAKGVAHSVHMKVLDTAQWAASVNTVHPSMHRLLNASFLTAGLFGGRTMMNLFTGQTPSGKEVSKEDVPEPLKPLHGILAYNHFSDHPSDRWMKVMDLWLPAAIGAAGAVAGSHVFALDQFLVRESKAALKAPELITIDVAEKASIMTQAKPWRMLSGVTSLFGSAAGFQLIPGPTNYGTTLGASFLGTVERNKLHTPYMPWLQEFVSANKHPFAYGPASMLNKLHKYLIHNPEKELEQAQKMSYAILEPWFGEHATPQHVEAFVKHVTGIRDKFLREGGVPEQLKESLHQELEKTLHGVGLEKTLEKIGLDPAEATVGRNGFMEKFSRMLGYDKTISRISEQYRLGYLKRAGRLADEVVELAPHDDSKIVKWVGRSAVATAGTAVAAGAVNAQYWHKQDNETLLHRAIGKTNPNSSEAKAFLNEQELLEESKADVGKTTFAERIAKDHHRMHYKEAGGIIGAINHKPLGIMEWGADALNSPETHGMHRVYCAAGLSLGGLMGMKIMDVLTGMTLAGKEIKPEQVPEFLMGLYKKMAYNPHSDHPKDRWGYVAHFALPALTATVGVIGASSYFFKDKVEKSAKAEYLDEYETRATMDEARPWTGLTALTSLFATPAGFGFLPPPFPNYGTALGTRFNLSAGRKVILPVIGDIWTQTESKYPYAPPRLIDHMIQYAVNNPDHHPEQLEEMTIGILKPWFKNVSKEQIEDFIRVVEADRNQFLECGGIPEEMRDNAERTLRAHLKGAGLEETLKHIGLDPMQATLGQNGLSGKIAEYLGGADALAKTKESYKKTYAERQQELEKRSKTEPPIILEESSETGAVPPMATAEEPTPIMELSSKERIFQSPNTIETDLPKIEPSATHMQRYEKEASQRDTNPSPHLSA